MTIPEQQLNTWSSQGSVTQSRATYSTLKGVLELRDAPYVARSFTDFLQGSYANDTNIYADSDVDVVMRLDSTFYHDLNELSESDKTAYQAAYSNAEYSYSDFKGEVISHLKKNFGSAVRLGKKAISIEGNGARRNADVLVAAQYRKYQRFRSLSDEKYVEGICFWDTDGTQIINYPKQHSDNCTNKHQAANQWFKPMVRVLKNMRNRMIDDGRIEDGLAPSYFLEGMLYNVPNENFGRSFGETFVDSVNWLLKTDRSKLVCANEQFYLLNATSPVTWRDEKCARFLNAAVKFWNES